MKYRWPAMLIALAVSGWLALWGDKTPPDAAAVVQPVASSAASGAARADEAPRQRSWAPRDRAAMHGWLVASVDPFRPLNGAPAASAPTGAAPADAAVPMAVLGRGQVESGRETVFVQVGDEIHGLQIGSRVAGLQVLGIQPDALLLRHLRTQETLRLPLGAPSGVFDQTSPP